MLILMKKIKKTIKNLPYLFILVIAYLVIERWMQIPNRETKMLWVIILFLGVVFFVGMVLVKKINRSQKLKTVTDTSRGTKSERELVLQLLKIGISSDMIFHDLYVTKDNGHFAQIDLVALTEVGVIVFEVKEYSGWIFGTGYQEQWTQVLAYGKMKYRFQNPILQNRRHIDVLKRKLRNYGNVPFYSVVVFYGKCELKDVSFIPKDTYLLKPNRIKDVLDIIRKENSSVNYPDINETIKILKEAVSTGENPENQAQHIENIQEMLGKERILD